MKLLIMGEGLRPQQVDAKSVIVMRDDGTPFMAAGEISPHFTPFAHANDPEFSAVLHQLGHDRTIIVDRI